MVVDIFRRGGSYIKKDIDPKIIKKSDETRLGKMPITFAQIDYAPSKSGLDLPRPRVRALMVVLILTFVLFEEMARFILNIGPAFGGFVQPIAIDPIGQLVGVFLLAAGLAALIIYYLYMRNQGIEQGIYRCDIGLVIWYNGLRAKSKLIDMKRVINFYTMRAMEGVVLMARVKGRFFRERKVSLFHFNWNEDGDGVLDTINNLIRTSRG